MYAIIINDGEAIYFYSQGEGVKIYATRKDAIEEIKELQKMEENLFNDIQIKYKVVKISE